MNIFDWLLIGHLLGDWLLQNDWMARGKKQAFFTCAGMVHFTLYTATTLGTLWFSNTVATTMTLYLGFGAFIFTSHWLIDATDVVERWMRLYQQSNLALVRLMVDQALHLLVLALLAAAYSGG